jgi:hypothetical protein
LELDEKDRKKRKTSLQEKMKAAIAANKKYTREHSEEIDQGIRESEKKSQLIKEANQNVQTPDQNPKSAQPEVITTVSSKVDDF